MIFEMTLGEHFTIPASASMFHIAIDYKNKTNMKVTASNIYISCFLKNKFLVSA